MIESRYNFYIPDGEKILFFNGVSGKVFSVSKENSLFLKKIICNEENQLKEPEICDYLIQMRFLVESYEAEFNYLKKLNRRKIKDSEYYLVVNPTQNCIFKCWYCYETHLKSNMKNNVRSNVNKLIYNTLERPDIESFALGWFGGEPLMYFDEVVYPLSLHAWKEAKMRGKAFNNSMTTNGYLLTKHVIEKCNDINLRRIQVTLDGDEERHNSTRNMKGKPSFKTIIQNCIDYCSFSHNNTVILRINFTDEIIQTDFSQVLDIIPKEIRPQMNVQFKRVWQTYDKKKQKTPDGLMKNKERVRSMCFNSSCYTDYAVFSGYSCYADRLNYANINFDGKVYRCTAMDYNSDNSLGYLSDEGEIVWDLDKLKYIDAKPYFDNSHCSKCKFLPICGGPCFQKRYQSLIHKTPFCSFDKADISTNDFIKEYYFAVQKDRKLQDISSPA